MSRAKQDWLAREQARADAPTEQAAADGAPEFNIDDWGMPLSAFMGALYQGRALNAELWIAYVVKRWSVARCVDHFSIPTGSQMLSMVSGYATDNDLPMYMSWTGTTPKGHYANTARKQ